MAPRSRSTSRLAGAGSRAPVTERNLLLSRLPDSELDALLENAEVIKPTLREIFFELHDAIDRVLFPLTGMASLVTMLKDGTSLEAMTVGSEGFVGLPLFHGLKTSPVKAMCQIEGEFHVVPAKSFREKCSLNLRHFSRCCTDTRSSQAKCSLNPRRATRCTSSSNAAPAGC